MNKVTKVKTAQVPFFLFSRYVLRGNKGTLLMTVFLMALVFTNLNFINSLLNGMVENANTQVIETLSGHITLEPSDEKTTIDDLAETMDKISGLDHVVALAPHTTVPAQISKGNREVSFRVVAIDPMLEKQVTSIHEHLIAGQYLEEGDFLDIVLGQQIVGGEDVEFNALSLKGVAIGEKIQLSMPDGLTVDFRVKGIFDTDFVQSDIIAYVPDRIFDLAGPEFEDRAQSILIKLDERGVEQEVIAQIKQLGIDVNTITWEESAGVMRSVSESFTTINSLLTSIGLVVAGVTIFITVYVDVINKKREIGILRAIGIKSWVVWNTYILQAIFFSVFGILLGAGILHLVLVPYFSLHPLHFPIGNVSLVVNSHDAFKRGLLLIAVAILAGFVPAWRATRQKLLDAIWG